ncbi:MAG: endo alpha-1,4 polygalactosaminidase [Candidatus Riflebacteria bacterium]|nr:endo alpha-1,4 polygalactosaminidase [Candidatus Riflebacteria bacterium]
MERTSAPPGPSLLRPLSIVIVIVLVTGCSGSGDSGGGGTAPSRASMLEGVRSWGYQLQGYESGGLDAIHEAGFGLMVVGYSSDGSEAAEFTAEQVAYMKNSGDPGRSKLVLAYMSIGEAETWRFYFDPAWVTEHPDGSYTVNRPPAPDFLCDPNPAWPGAFKVRYWDPNWQRIIISNPGAHPIIGDRKSYLDRIIDAGFDGVYLDIVDAFQYFGPTEIGGNDERRSAACDMVTLVAAIAQHARAVRGKSSFLVVPQNGSTILDEANYPADTLPQGTTPGAFALKQGLIYLNAMDAIGAESTFYFGDRENNNRLDVQTTALAALRSFRASGKPVLAVDYLSPSKPNPDGLPFPDTVDDFYQRCQAERFIPYATVRMLDTLTINPTQPPAR